VLTGVYWIPRLRNSIISVEQMDEGGSRVLIEGDVLKIWDRQRRLLARVQRTENRMYRLELQVARPLCLAVHQDDEAWWWHERLSHANFGSLEKLEMVRGLPLISHAEQFCDTCVGQASSWRVPEAEQVLREQCTGASERRSLLAGQASDSRRAALLSTTCR
jgi:hypothetical protein